MLPPARNPGMKRALLVTSSDGFHQLTTSKSFSWTGIRGLALWPGPRSLKSGSSRRAIIRSMMPPLSTAAFSATAASFGILALLTRFNGRWHERRCTVEAGSGSLTKYVLEALAPYLDAPYRPWLPFPDRHIDTIFAAFFRSLPRITFRRECLRMPDGGTVAIDWPLDREALDGAPPAAQGAPVLILLPGLTGGSEDTYVRHMVLRARQQGWAVVVFNSRGCAHSPVTTPQFYSASFTDDLRAVAHHVSAVFPSSRLYAAGWSLGANILVRYLGQEGRNTPLRGAVSLCNPFDLVLADRNFHVGFNNIYDRRLALSLNNIFSRHSPLFEGIGGDYNIDMVKSAKTVREFDDGLTRVSFGYPTVDHYYSDASSSHSIPGVGVPLLCIQAEDDPIAPIEGVPLEGIKNNPNCVLVVTPFGGHLGWVAGPEGPLGCPWTDPVVMRFLEAIEKRCAAGIPDSPIEGNNGGVRAAATSSSFSTG